MSALKYDDGKPPLGLLPLDAVMCVAFPFGHGKKKYEAADNWREGMEWRRILGSALRHLGYFESGQDIDPESGYEHIWHAGACILMLIWYKLHGIGIDDRYKTPPKNTQQTRLNSDGTDFD